MNANRLWMLGGAVAAVAIVVLGWIVGISPQLQQASAADDQKVSAQSQLQQTELQLTQLKKDYASIGQLKAQLSTLQQSLPGTSQVTDFVRQLAQQSAAAGVAVSSITVGEPTAYAPAASGSAPAASPAPSPSAPTPSATAAPSTGPTPNATAAAVAPPVSTDPLVTSANFVMLPVTLSISGEQAGLMSFTSSVQNQGPRLFLVNKIDLKQGAGAADSQSGAASDESATLSGFIYVLIGN
ncbi:hypothetical protein [Gryllotalpicola koreensis]|uniref:Tfp pilus assembly protein PilO n=1 Tax=Gryllotalpicola koreensis TaxID=993086 RepID=A0ABP8A4S4_9MICO